MGARRRQKETWSHTMKCGIFHTPYAVHTILFCGLVLIIARKLRWPSANTVTIKINTFVPGLLGWDAGRQHVFITLLLAVSVRDAGRVDNGKLKCKKKLRDNSDFFQFDNMRLVETVTWFSRRKSGPLWKITRDVWNEFSSLVTFIPHMIPFNGTLPARVKETRGRCRFSNITYI